MCKNAIVADSRKLEHGRSSTAKQKVGRHVGSVGRKGKESRKSGTHHLERTCEGFNFFHGSSKIDPNVSPLGCQKHTFVFP